MFSLFIEHWKLIACLLIALMFIVGNPKLTNAIKDMINPEHPYERRKDFFSPAESNFDKVLRVAVKDDYRIMGKVRVADLLQVKRGVPKKDRPSAQNKINGKHIDFVLIDPKSLQVACCIELDDKSHEQKARIIRDKFLNTAFDAAKLPLLRIPCKRTYQPEHLRKLITRAAKMSNEEIRKMMLEPEQTEQPEPTPDKPKPVVAVNEKPKQPESNANDVAETKTESVVESPKPEQENDQNSEMTPEKFAKYLETYNKT